METCARTLELLCTEGHSLYTRCDVARSTIVDMIVASYKDAIDDWRNLLLGEETPNADETFNVVSSLKKVSLFYACHNLNQWNLWGTLFQDVKVIYLNLIKEFPNKSVNIRRPTTPYHPKPKNTV